MSWGELLPLVLLGAVLGLDVVSFPQAMISRPIVAATLAGTLLANPLAGLVAGATLELIALETLPFGASRYPEWGSAAVVGGALFAGQPDGRAGALTLAVLGALATAWIGGGSMVALRRLNGRWAEARRDRIEAGERWAVVGLQMRGIVADFVRGGALTFLAFLALSPTLRAVIELWSIDPRVSRAAVVGTAATVAAVAAWKLFHAVPHAAWYFAAGLAAGLGVLLSR